MRVEFGNIRLQFTPVEFNRFNKLVEGIDLSAYEMLNIAQPRPIAINLRNTGVVVALTGSECLELRRLLQEALDPPVRTMLKLSGLPSSIEWAQQRMN